METIAAGPRRILWDKHNPSRQVPLNLKAQGPVNASPDFVSSLVRREKRYDESYLNTKGAIIKVSSVASWIPLSALRRRNGVPNLGCLVFACLLVLAARVSATEDPPGCSLSNGGAGNTSQGGINFNLALAHVGDTVPVFPSLGMASNACRALNATGAVYIATGLLTNFLVNVTLDPATLVSCPANGLCRPGPYMIALTPTLVGTPVTTPLGSFPGLSKRVRVVSNGFGTVLAGPENDRVFDTHSTAIQIVTPCLQVSTTCDLAAGQGCFSVGTPVRFRGAVTNCGDITLTNVTVRDDRAGQLQLFNPANSSALTNNVILPPGAYAVFSNSFAPELLETCAGRATNVVTATGTDTTTIGGPRASVTNSFTDVCAICINPAIVVTRTCPTGPLVPGGPLNFSGAVTNTGNVTLTNVTVMTDRLLTNGDTRVASFPTLTQGEFRTFSGSYVVPEEACSITDTLTVRGTSFCGVADVTNAITTTCRLTNPPPTITCAPNKTVAFGTPWNFDPPRAGFGFGTNVIITVLHTQTNLVCRDRFTAVQTWRVTDSCGNFSECSQTVAVMDPTPPAILCSSNLELTADPGQCSRSNVTFTVAATDDCGVTNLVSNPPSGSTFPVGVTTVTTTATDANGNQSSCSFTVTVTDAQNSIFTCSSNLVFTADAGRCSRSNVIFFVSATDNCSVTNLVSSMASGSTFPVGTTTVTNTVTDASGNTSSCTFTVTVTDNQNPAIICSSNLVLTADAGRCSRSNVVFFVSGTDNCSVTNLVNSTASGSTFPLGTTTVTNTVTDASGNTSSCTFTVTVTDNQNPAIICSSNLVLTADAGRCSRSNVVFFVSAADNCNVTNLVSSTASGSTFPVGTTTVTNTATDASGNTTRCTFTVTVLDNEYPVITCSSNLVLAADPGRCSRSNVVFFVSAADNCNVTNLVSSTASGSTFPVGTTTVTNTVTDANGNTSSCTFTVTVTETQNAAITCSSNLVLTADPGRCSRSNVTFFVSATDNCSVTNLVSSRASGSTFPIGTTTVTNTVTDASGNTSSCTFTVTVTDNQNPAITCSSNLVLAADAGRCSRSNVIFLVNGTDNCSVTNLVSSTASGSTFPVGTTTVTNTATDANGNTSSCTFTVTVTDNQFPVITCSSNLVLTADPGRCSRSNVIFLVSATDNCSATNLVSSTASGSTFPIGTTTVTNTVTDASGNTSSCTFTVTVTDTQNAAITCSSNLVLTADPGRCSRSNVTFFVSATDNCSVTNLVSSRASGSTFPIGTTTVTNTVTDASGNTSSCTFTVTVTDNQNPAITCPGNLVLTADAGRCSRSNVVFSVSATDNCSVAKLVSSPPTGSTFPFGTTTVTSTATDVSGNQSSCNFTVTVLDLQPPAILCPPDLTTNTLPGANAVTNLALGTPFTADNCAVAGVSNNAPAILPVGTNLVLWTVTDGSGNTNSCQQRVVVVRACSGVLNATPLAAQAVCPNQPVRFEMADSSPEPITHLWKFNGQPIAGQTNNFLVLPFANASHAGVYSVEVRTECAAVTYSAMLTVLPAPSASLTAYTNSGGIVIDESGEATPYSSVITPSCVPGRVKNLTVTVFGFFHAFPQDVSAVLVGPDGRQVKLMAGTGGRMGVSSSVNLTFSDAAITTLPETDLIVSGTYRPTDYLPGLTLPPPAAGPYSNSLATFIGIDPNGPWKLCVFDSVPLDGGGISSWRLELDWREDTLYLQNPSVLPNGQFRVEVMGQTGIPTILERSSNLTTWLPVVTNVYGTTPGVFIDPAPLYPNRFYRAMQP